MYTNRNTEPNGPFNRQAIRLLVDPWVAKALPGAVPSVGNTLIADELPAMKGYSFWLVDPKEKVDIGGGQ